MESILNEAGSCGNYQIIHLISAQLPRFLASWIIVFMMFGAFNPGWRCGHQDEADVYSSNHSNKSITQNSSDSYYAFLGGSTMFDVTNNSSSYELDDLGPYNGTCNDIDRCEYGIEFNPSSSTITTEFELVCDRAWLLRAILLVQSTGILFVPLLAGQIGDKFGRKFSLYGCTAIVCVFTGLAIFSHHWVMFAICYFFIGGASNSTLGISPVFSMEVLNSKWRGYYNSIPTANIAMLLFTVVSSFVRDWVHLHAITCAMAFVACLGFLMVPESPRWLVVNGQVLKAEEAIQTIARFNKRDRIARASFRKFQEAIKKQANMKAYTIFDLFRNKQLAIITAKFCVLFLLLSITYMSTSFGITSLPGDYYTNAIMATGIEVVFVTICGPLCNIIGRRYTGLGCGIIGTISCFVVLITMSTADESVSRNWTVNIFAYFAKSSSQAMFCVGTTLNTEIFPTVVRSAVGGLLRCCVGVGGLIMPFLLPSKDDHSLTVYFGIMVALYLGISIIFSTFPETNKCNLADSLLGKGKELTIETPLEYNVGDDGVGGGSVGSGSADENHSTGSGNEPCGDLDLDKGCGSDNNSNVGDSDRGERKDSDSEKYLLPYADADEDTAMIPVE